MGVPEGARMRQVQAAPPGAPTAFAIGNPGEATSPASPTTSTLEQPPDYPFFTRLPSQSCQKGERLSKKSMLKKVLLEAGPVRDTRWRLGPAAVTVRGPWLPLKRPKSESGLTPPSYTARKSSFSKLTREASVTCKAPTLED